tara:strand:+ start:2020 stop:3027 length:1008 start_codon:yes stop_codon:yes gene_type:complete
MIKPFSRDTAFFHSLRDRNMTIAHRDLDNSFNELVEYLNSVIAKTIDILADKEAVGVDGNDDSFLRNVGDGTTIFDIVRNSDIADSILPLDRFAKAIPFAILASNNNENLKSVLATADNQSLVADTSNLPNWSKLTFVHFSDSTITAVKVGLAALSARHLTPDILGKPLDVNSIESQHIQDNTIEAAKIVNGSITNTKIGVDLLNTRVAGANLKFKAKCFSSRTIANNSVNLLSSFSYYDGVPKFRGILTPACIPINAVKLNTTAGKINVREQMDAGVISPNIKDNSLDIPAIMLKVNLTVSDSPVSTSQSKPIDKTKLSPEFKAILVNKGGLAP